MVISNYYLSLSGKVKSKFIQDVIELCGISYPSFFYKMRNNSWTKLEREAIERFIQKIMRNQVEFYNTPSGYVMCDDGNYTTRLSESSREVVDELLDTIRECYSDAYRALEQCYSKSSKNSRYQKFRIVNRFIRCNCGELDTQKIDFIDGNINIEQVHCPLRGSGDCQYENVICNPKRTSALTVRQLQIAAALAEGLTPQEVSDRLYISIHTVHNTIQAIKVKLNLKNTTQIISWYNNMNK